MHRVLIAPQSVQGGSVAIRDPHALHHLRNVLRLQKGDPLECFDGRGQAYAGVITHCGRQRVTVAIARQRSERPPRVGMTLAQALIRPEQFEWVVQKATELGVTRMVPMVTLRSTVRLRSESSSGGQRFTRWQRIMEAAATQCGPSASRKIHDSWSCQHTNGGT